MGSECENPIFLFVCCLFVVCYVVGYFFVFVFVCGMEMCSKGKSFFRSREVYLGSQLVLVFFFLVFFI